MQMHVERREVFNPDMVVIGRESRGLTQKKLADELSVTQSRISKIEMGMLTVTDELIDGMSRVLGYPRPFFFLEGRTTGVGVAELFHRKKQAATPSTLARIYAQIEICVKHISILIRAKDITCNIPRIDPDEYGGRAEEVARLVRSMWHLPRGPIDNLAQAVERAGVMIMPIRFETRHVDAISKWVPGLPPIFFVNIESPKDRRRYSIAHELGHIVMHDNPSPAIEDQANAFASEFLMPEREIVSDLGDINLPKLAVLKRYWKASMASILMRAETLGTITPNQARYLWAQMAKAGYKTREPSALDVQGEDAQALADLIEIHRGVLSYSDVELAEVLGLYPAEFTHLYLLSTRPAPLRLIRPSDN